MAGSRVPASDDCRNGAISGHAPLPLETLTKRSEFQRAARSARVAMPAFILQMHRRREADATGIRVGFTCSRKVGNAVARNRAKRRLREIARAILPLAGRDGTDYVLIGRRDVTATRPFGEMQADLRQALERLHRERT